MAVGVGQIDYSKPRWGRIARAALVCGAVAMVVFGTVLGFVDATRSASSPLRHPGSMALHQTWVIEGSLRGFFALRAEGSEWNE